MCTLPGNQGETSREPASVEGKQGLLPSNLDLKDLPSNIPQFYQFGEKSN